MAIIPMVCRYTGSYQYNTCRVYRTHIIIHNTINSICVFDSKVTYLIGLNRSSMFFSLVASELLGHVN